ncbi:hypothetical protein ABE504_23765 [Paenibacillus oryzisoli]|uniref:hypothetical protein n=1 Tax=Paenibacillus oryzisoli TaxID=1850517 RepID=UPI003D2AB1E9
MFEALITKEQVNQAFRAIQKNGVRVRQNFVFFPSDGYYKMEEKGYINYCFYTRQDEFSNGFHRGRLYLKWSGNPNLIIEGINSVEGIFAHWSGDEGECIAITNHDIEEEYDLAAGKIEKTKNFEIMDLQVLEDEIMGDWYSLSCVVQLKGHDTPYKIEYRIDKWRAYGYVSLNLKGYHPSYRYEKKRVAERYEYVILRRLIKLPEVRLRVQLHTNLLSESCSNPYLQVL